MKRIILANTVFVLCLFLAAQTTRAQSKLFNLAPDTSQIIPPPNDSAFLRGIRVTLNLALLDSNNLLKIILPGHDSLIIEKKRRDSDTAGKFAWFGVIQHDPGSFVLFSAVSHVITGRIIKSTGKQYRISYLGNNIHEIAEMDPSKLNVCSSNMIGGPSERFLPDMEGGCPDSPLDIDVMVVYTEDALTNASGGTGTDDLHAIESLIYQNIYMSNFSYENSNIRHRLRLVHMEKINYVESRDFRTDLANVQQGTIVGVHNLRDLYKADVVVLMVESLTVAGFSYILSENDPSEAFAYCVVTRYNAAAEFTFPHEIGHIMGARHEWGNDPANMLPYNFNHGYLSSWRPSDGTDLTWKTIMSVTSPDDGSYWRKLYWSNPNLNYPLTGLPMGSTTEDNAQSLNLSAPMVSQFRCGSPHVNTVWMKDTYNDTGLEPDPNTTGQSMSASPYIWIRNSRDDVPDPFHPYPFPNQHIHQNPLFGQTNWIYVKMHNGGPAVSGKLEIYTANASTSLIWPDSWTLVPNTPVNLSVDGNSTKIAEVRWDNIPGKGHYCMLARWVSTVDPVGPDVQNVTEYTRQNNNVIWRNLNIVDLSQAEQATVEMDIQNTTGDPFSLEFSDTAIFPKTPFTATGKIFLVPDPVLYKAIKKGKSKYSNLRFEDGKILVLNSHASLGKIKLSPKYKGKLTILFMREKKTITDQYQFTVKQFSISHNIKTLVGEVGYDIYTYKIEKK
ncbi:MAG: M12 family metallo-peptidase [Chitinophagaceae bacterium]